MSSLRLESVDLETFVRRVSARALAYAENEALHPDQRRLLNATLSLITSSCHPGDPAQPLGLLYLIFRACGRSADEQAELVGTFCFLYVCALDLFDDMQDNDLAGKPHEEAGPAIASNSAIALLFLALDALRAASVLEQDPALGQRYLLTLNRVSLITVGCQHADLLGQSACSSPADVLAMHRGKTATVALFFECGALLGGADPALVAAYGNIGRDLAGLIQIVDDLRDIYGKTHSPDLAAKAVTYPLACFHQVATPSQKEQLQGLLVQRPIPLDKVRELLHEAAAVEQCAFDLEQIRVAIHRAIAAMNGAKAEHRMLLGIVDAVAATIYEVEPVSETAHFWQPEGGFDELVRGAAADFVRRLPRWCALVTPRLEPWHQPFFLYEMERRVIYYPDVDGLPNEVLPFHARLLGLSEAACRLALIEMAPALVAHEIVHALRHEYDLLTEDYWHEEYVANRLAVGFVAARDVSEVDALAAQADARGEDTRTLPQIRELARRTLLRAPDQWLEEGGPVLQRMRHPTHQDAGYGVSDQTAALLHWQMVSQLIDERPTFDADLERYVGGSRHRESAAE